MILGHLQLHRRNAATSATKELNNIEHFFCGHRICKNMYLFLHDMGRDRYNNLIQHYDEKGEHGIIDL